MEEDNEELKTITSLLEKELKLINKLKEFTLITFSITSIILSIISLSYIKELQAKNEVLAEKIEILNDQIED